jgi:hypothetical protein
MTAQEPTGVVLFESVSHALRAEKLVKASGISCKLIPVPRHLSSDCGVCMRFAMKDSETIKILLSPRIEFFEIHSL